MVLEKAEEPEIKLPTSSGSWKKQESSRKRGQTDASHVSHTPTACSFPGENARSWEALGEARPGQSSLSAGALRITVPACSQVNE